MGTMNVLIAQGLDAYLENGSAHAAKDYTPFNDAVIIAFDLEWNARTKAVTEVGVARLDTRDLIPDDVSSWWDAVEINHLIVECNSRLRPRARISGGSQARSPTIRSPPSGRWISPLRRSIIGTE